MQHYQAFLQPPQRKTPSYFSDRTRFGLLLTGSVLWATAASAFCRYGYGPQLEGLYPQDLSETAQTLGFIGAFAGGYLGLASCLFPEVWQSDNPPTQTVGGSDIAMDDLEHQTPNGSINFRDNAPYQAPIVDLNQTPSPAKSRIGSWLRR